MKRISAIVVCFLSFSPGCAYGSKLFFRTAEHVFRQKLKNFDFRPYFSTLDLQKNLRSCASASFLSDIYHRISYTKERVRKLLFNTAKFPFATCLITEEPLSIPTENSGEYFSNYTEKSAKIAQSHH